MFGLGRKGRETANKLTGRTDLLEACCAGAILVGMADGELSKSEIALLPQTILANAQLAKSFNQQQINAAVQRQAQRASAGMSGRRELWKQIDDVANMGDVEASETVAVVCIDIAMVDGSIGDAERKTLDKIGDRLGVSIQALLDL